MTTAPPRATVTTPTQKQISRSIPRRVLESAAMADTAPGTAKKRVYSSGPTQVPSGYEIPDDSVELDCHDVAVLLTYLGRPTVEATVRSYKRNGIMPVPDFQLGGREPAPGEKIKCWSNGPRERDPAPGERIGATYRWRGSTIVAWNATRSGGGRPRKNTDDGDTTSPNGPWAPRRVKRTTDQDDTADDE